MSPDSTGGTFAIAFGMPKFATPEEAARAFISDPAPRFVGTAVRGDVAVVGHWVKAYGGDAETTTCYRDDEGWEAGSTGNSSGACIFTGDDRVTWVYWDRGPEGAVAGRFQADDREQVVPVEDGFFFLIFDDLPYTEPTWELRQDRSASGGGDWTGYERTNATPEELRAQRTALRGFEYPELIEWVFADNEEPD